MLCVALIPAVSKQESLLSQYNRIVSRFQARGRLKSRIRSTNRHRIALILYHSDSNSGVGRSLYFAFKRTKQKRCHPA